MMRLTEQGRVLLSALIPTVEELADRAQDLAHDLTAAEALAVGASARGLILGTIETILENSDEGDSGEDEPPPVI